MHQPGAKSTQASTMRPFSIGEKGLGMSKNVSLSALHKTALRAVNDPEFTKTIQEKGRLALAAGPGTKEYAEYFDLFSTTPGDLAHLGPGPDALACTCESNTVTTLSTLVTPITNCCTFATTTTTSGG